MNRSVSGRQTLAWAFCAVSAPAVIRVAGLSWSWVLPAGAFAGVWLLALSRLRAHAGMSAAEACRIAFGQRFGAAAAAALLIWLVLTAAKAANLARVLFAQTVAAPAAPAVLLALAAVGSAKGTAACARAAGVWALLTGLLLGLVLAGACGMVQIAWMAPWGGAEQFPPALIWLLTPAALIYLPAETRSIRQTAAAAAALAILPAGFSLMVSGGLSPQLAEKDPFALYALTKSISLFSVMQRFEALLSVGAMVGLCMLLTMLLCAAQELCRTFVPHAPAALPAALGAAAYGAGFVAERIPAWAEMTGAAVFWGFFPAAALWVVARKKG